MRADVAKLDLPPAPSVCVQSAAHTQPLAWDDLLALAAKPLSTERYIPPAVNGLLAEVTRTLLQNLHADEGAPTAALMYVLPKLCWPSFVLRPQGRAPKGRQRQRLISMRLQAVLQGQAHLLFHEAMQQPDALPTYIADDEPMNAADPALTPQEAAKLFKHVSRGEQCAALKRIRAQPLAPPTKASWDAAWAKLNPESSPDLVHAGPSPVWRPEPKHWATTVERLRPGKALDPGGWSHEILQQAWMTAAIAQRIRDWLETSFARASVPEAQLTQMHRSVLLTKPNSSSIRPILVSTIWKKILAGATTHAVKPLFQPLFEHSQYGIGIAGGASSMLRNLMSQHLQHEHFAFLQLDFANAFGAIHRTAVQAAIEHTLGDHASVQWIKHYLAQQVTIAVPTTARAECGTMPSCVHTSCGLPQGDPLSALLFCATVTWALQRHLPQELGHVEYVDDVVLSGPIQAIDEGFQDLKQQLAAYGLHLEATKCKLWDPTRAHVPNHPHIRALWEQELIGLAICGSCLAPDTDEELPLGSEDFRSRWFQGKADQIMNLCAQIDTIPRVAEDDRPSLQLAAKFLAEVVPARLRHIWAASPWNEQSAFLEAIEEITMACLKSLLGVQNLLPAQKTVALLPAYLGGLGFCNIITEAVLARTSELVAAPRSEITSPSILHAIDKEREALFTLLQQHLDIPIESVFGTLVVAPLGRQPKRLARSARKLIYSTTAKRLQEMLNGEPISLMAHEFRRLQLDEDQPIVGLCMQTWPSSWKTSLFQSADDPGLSSAIGVSGARSPRTLSTISATNRDYMHCTYGCCRPSLPCLLLPPCTSSSPHDGVRPVLFELGGAMSRSTWAFGRHVIHALHGTLQRSMAWGTAWAKASREFWSPLAFIIERTRCSAEAACSEPGG